MAYSHPNSPRMPVPFMATSTALEAGTRSHRVGEGDCFPSCSCLQDQASLFFPPFTPLTSSGLIFSFIFLFFFLLLSVTVRRRPSLKVAGNSPSTFAKYQRPRYFGVGVPHCHHAGRCRDRKAQFARLLLAGHPRQSIRCHKLPRPASRRSFHLAETGGRGRSFRHHHQSQHENGQIVKKRLTSRMVL